MALDRLLPVRLVAPSKEIPEEGRRGGGGTYNVVVGSILTSFCLCLSQELESR